MWLSVSVLLIQYQSDTASQLQIEVSHPIVNPSIGNLKANSFMFGDFETRVKKEAVREVAVENYDIFFSREEIWFCLNRKKSFDITKALIVGNNLKIFKMLQTNDNISKSQNSEF